MSTKSLAAERIKQNKLYKIRILLFGCRKDLPKNAQSGDSLVCTPKASQVVDVSSSGSDIDRIPAGTCGCSGVREVSTSDACTQTEDDDTRPDGLNRKDELSVSELSNNSSSRAFLEVKYTNVSKKFQPPSSISVEEHEPQPDTTAVCEEISRKYIKRPRIVIDGKHVSGGYNYQNQLPRAPNERQPTRSQPIRGQEIRNQPPRVQQPRIDAKSSRGQQKPTTVAFQPPKQTRQLQHGQLPPVGKVDVPTTPNGELIGNRIGSDRTQDQQTQYEEPEKNCTRIPEGSASTACTRIPELFERVCQLEKKMRCQERTLKGLQSSMQSSTSTKCNDSQAQSGCKPKSVNQCTQKSKCSIQSSAKSCMSSTSACPNQGPPNCGAEEKTDCKALKKEFIEIFTKKDLTECTKKDCEKPIKICPRNNTCIDGRKMCIQCLENSDVLMQQFTHMFVNPGGQGLNFNPNKSMINQTPSLEQFEQPEPETEFSYMKPEKEISACLPIATKQCLTERESEMENVLDKCVDVVATKSNFGLVSSDPCLPTNNAPMTFDTRQCLQKEVYESLMEQFVNYFTKPKTECGLNPLPAQKADGGESYTFEHLCAELSSLISKTKNLELGAVMNEETGLKRASNTILKKDQAVCQDNCISGQSDERDDDKPCKVEYVSNDPLVSSGDNGNLPVLDSLVDEMTNLIGSRPFQHVVLTIMRRGCNVYHINIRERATGNVLGCLLANGAAVNEAISHGLFEDIPTFCELNRQITDDPKVCPADAIAPPQREPGGETQLAKKEKAKAMEFVTRVLGLPIKEAERFFSLTSALKTAKKSSDQSLGETELSKVTESTGLIGRGAVADNLIYLGTTGSQLDVSELGEASKHFLRLLSGMDTEDNEKF